MILPIITFMNKKYDVKEVVWQKMESHLRYIRTTVFIEEQNVPEELEWDEYDETSMHVIVELNGEYIATARLLESGQIGRMAVLKPHRNSGVGSAVMAKLLLIAKSKNMQSVFLNAQVDALAFYKKFDFIEVGDVFDDVGIPHIRMTKQLM
jgi:predicted GNAT family N-acyltransferase